MHLSVWRVPRGVFRWALKKAGVEEWLVENVMALYKEAETAYIRDQWKLLSREMSGSLPLKLLYAGDWRKVKMKLRENLLACKFTLEAKGLNINVSKTKVMFGGKCNRAR